MGPLKPLIKKYERKLKKKFNKFLDSLELGLKHYNKTFADTELHNIRDLIIEHTKNMRKSLVDLMNLFRKVEDPDFMGQAQMIFQALAKSIEQAEFAIREELFNHIDYDILGRIKLGINQAPLSIRG
jgi:hypothetical protein